MPRLLAVLVASLILLSAVSVRAGNEALSEDEVLYGCGKPKGKFAVSLKPDVELKDLVTWAMGFSCKKFLYASSLAGRSSIRHFTGRTGDLYRIPRSRRLI